MVVFVLLMHSLSAFIAVVNKKGTFGCLLEYYVKHLFLKVQLFCCQVSCQPRHLVKLGSKSKVFVCVYSFLRDNRA